MSDTTAETGQCLRIAGLAVGFAAGMVVHEVVLEEIFRLPDLPKSLPLWITLVEQFFCASCAWLPLLCQTEVLRGPKASFLEINDLEHLGNVSDSGSIRTSALFAFIQDWGPYAGIASMICLGTTVATQSSMYVDYTVKVVFKSSKLLPTMVSSALIGNSINFSCFEYVAALCICSGTASFLIEERSAKHKHVPYPSLLLGTICLVSSISVDAIAPNVQQWVMREREVSPDMLIRRVNGIGFLIVAIAALSLGEMPEMIKSIWASFIGLGITLAFSIMCQIRLIKAAGSVVSVGVATLRKSCTLSLSYLLFPGKTFSVLKAIGLIFVGVGLGLAEFESLRKKKQLLNPSNDHQASPIADGTVVEPSSHMIGVDSSVMPESADDVEIEG